MYQKILRLFGSLFLLFVITLGTTFSASAAATSSTVAVNSTSQLSPVADGFILDQEPFDGVGDAVEDSQGITTFFNSGIAEFRGAMEFDLSSIPQNNTIESAFLYVTPLGRSVPPNTSTIPIQLFGYSGNGIIETDDFNAGSSITIFDGLAAPFNVPVVLDVTEFLQNQAPMSYVGFGLRTDVNGAGVTFGSLELGSDPTLVINLITPVTQEVNIDIRPYTYLNIVNPRGLFLPVAILSSADFQAPKMVDTSSLTFGKTGDEDSLLFCLKRGVDVNRDKKPDLLCYFRIHQTGFEYGDTEGILKGLTVDNIPFEGSDSIQVLKPPKHKQH